MRLVWSRNARLELLEADRYHSVRDKEFADRLMRSARAASRFLLQHPDAGESVDEAGRRRWRLAGTQYLILYSRDGGTLRILHFVHAARDWTRFL